KLLLPKKGIDMSKWSVVACDQFTSEPEYWSELASYVGDAPSALKLIYPEVYLQEADKQQRVDAINKSMDDYLQNGIFDEVEALVLVDRTLASGAHRLGLMLEVDLEEYDYVEGAKSLIRATERTVVERLPARIQLRSKASLELPHIMLLMDDDNKNILSKVYKKREGFEVLYDFELNLGGGHLTGYKVDKPLALLKEISSLVSKENIANKYHDVAPILFAVGDGNHSLATAKECWNNIKKTLSKTERKNHPSRYALCELVSVYDEGLQFESIHRLVMGVGVHFIEFLQSMLGGAASTKAVFEGNEYVININNYPPAAIADIQSAIDVYLANHSEASIDYIHGDSNLLEVAGRLDAVALYMPSFNKHQLFDHIARKGVLPRKAFSMGHAEDKRYYTEAKKI
ncbi:MAG: DUF1015 domain-containing protein, partial [Clostridia bacterium]